MSISDTAAAVVAAETSNAPEWNQRLVNMVDAAYDMLVDKIKTLAATGRRHWYLEWESGYRKYWSMFFAPDTVWEHEGHEYRISPTMYRDKLVYKLKFEGSFYVTCDPVYEPVLIRW